MSVQLALQRRHQFVGDRDLPRRRGGEPVLQTHIRREYPLPVRHGKSRRRHLVPGRLRASLTPEEIQRPFDADRGQRVRPARLLAALDGQRGIGPQAGLLLLPERHVDLGPRGPQRRLALEGERNRVVEADARALVQIRPRRSA